ncbi:glycine rich domain-containing protein [Bacillus nitratireducens]|uniref:glycine rich domain-containing protein n=1 Tax=Bacillus nitratireducens TaxID=2026193 RepID=UPI002E24DD6C|nr:glycine rich domain-containing protein [Bacillus nitratireducens]
MGGIPLISNSSAYADSNSWDFQYTGNVQSFTVPYTGTYKLETWGAQGGNDILTQPYTYHKGGLGGYAEGEVSLTKGETIYVVVGGQGENTINTAIKGGYNGGGNSYHGSAGGGATHIATADGLLASLSNDKSAVLIVAGGGGGVDFGGKRDMDGGYAGGISGGPSYGNNKTATQTNGYSFGQGEPISSPFNSGAGGGGWYGGYHGEDENQYSYGGGGSSYIGGVSDGETIEGNQSMPSPSGGTQTGETGNGYARITCIKPNDTTSPVTTDNAPTDWVNKDVTVDLTATDNDGGSGVASTYYQLDNGSIQSGNTIQISDEGVHTLTYWSVDNAGNTEQFNTKTIKLDKTAPVLNISLDKTTIWPPNHKMVPITATINVSDGTGTSGINSVVLTSITSNETLQSDDIQNANYNKPISGSTDSFKLRADRLGSGNGRIYTVTYTAKDNTGNVTTKTATVTVPHDQSK